MDDWLWTVAALPSNRMGASGPAKSAELHRAQKKKKIMPYLWIKETLRPESIFIASLSVNLSDRVGD